ncbi:MAG: ABC transporter ATP-binding protein [Planctomycetaceae bacterium]
MSETTETVIEINGLSKTYRDGFLGRKKIPALKQVSFHVNRGEVFGLLGPNGAGKTTLIKILLGIVRKTSGEASVFGFRAGSRQTRKQIGYLPESHQIPRHLNGKQTLEYYGGLSGMSAAEVKRRRTRILEQVGLAKWANTSVKKYSKGMKQRLGLAQAILHQPDLIVLDEPTDGVDPGGRADIRRILRQLSERGVTVFLNSHLIQEIELVCDRVAILNQGSLVCVSGVTELTDDSSIRMQLSGSETSIRDAMGTSLENLKLLSEDLWQAQLSAVGQQEIDTVVDKLRQRDVSIQTLTKDSPSLEQAFLQLVKHETRHP